MVFIIAAMGTFSYLITPVYDEISTKRSEVRSRLSLKDEYQQSLDRIQDLKHKYKDVVESKTNISYILPPSQNTAEVVNQVSNVAAVNRLTIESLSVRREPVRQASNSAVSNGVAILRFSVRVLGSYENFRSYLSNLETNINLMDIRDLKIDSNEGVSGATGFSFSFILDTYYQTE